MKLKNMIGSLTAKFAALLVAFACAGSAWGANVAKIGNTEYTTLAKAVAAVPTDGTATTIVMLSNVKLSAYVTIAAKQNVTLDLNGKAITTTADASTGSHKYAIDNNGTLVLKDSVGTGSISARGVYNGRSNTSATMTIESGTYTAIDTDGGAAILNKGKLVVNGGTFNGKMCMYNSGSAAEMTVNGATVNGADDYAIKNVNGGTLTINDATVNSVYGSFKQQDGGATTINGGTFAFTGVEGSTTYDAYVTGGSLTIAGGSFLKTGNLDLTDEGSCILRVDSPAAATVKGGEFASATDTAAGLFSGAVSVKGGSFEIENGTTADVAAYAAPGYAIVNFSGNTSLYRVFMDNWERPDYADLSWYTANPGASTFEISSAAQFAGLAQLVNGKALNADGTPCGTSGGVTFSKKTITLTADIDLSAHGWVPIGYDLYTQDANVGYATKSFAGTFDGGGHTIKFVLSEQNSIYDDDALFGSVRGGTLKNIVLDATISYPGEISAGYWNPDIYGAACGLAASVTGGIVSNVTMNGSVVTGCRGASGAGLVGYAYYGPKFYDCVNNTSVSIKQYYTKKESSYVIWGGIVVQTTGTASDPVPAAFFARCVNNATVVMENPYDNNRMLGGSASGYGSMNRLAAGGETAFYSRRLHAGGIVGQLANNGYLIQLVDCEDNGSIVGGHAEKFDSEGHYSALYQKGSFYGKVYEGGSSTPVDYSIDTSDAKNKVFYTYDNTYIFNAEEVDLSACTHHGEGSYYRPSTSALGRIVQKVEGAEVEVTDADTIASLNNCARLVGPVIQQTSRVVFQTTTIIKNLRTNKKYSRANVATALSEAEVGDTLQLLADIPEFEGEIQFPVNNLTLDGDGHTITAKASANGDQMFNVHGLTATIKNITIDAQHAYTYCVQTIDAANLTLEDVTVLHGTKEWFAGFKYGAGVHVHDANLAVKGNFTAFSGGKTDESFPFTGILYEGGTIRFADGATASIANPEDPTDTDLLLVGMLGALDVSNAADREQVEEMLEYMNVPAGFYPYTLKLNPDEWNNGFEENTSFTGASPLGWNDIIDYGKAIMGAISMDTAETPVEVGLLEDTALPDTFTFEDANFTVNGNGNKLSGTIVFADSIVDEANGLQGSFKNVKFDDITLDFTQLENLSVADALNFDNVNVAEGATLSLKMTEVQAASNANADALAQLVAATGASVTLNVDGYTAVIENGELYIREAVAQVISADGATTNDFASLEAAVAASVSGETVLLVKDVDLGSAYVAIDKALTLAGDHTITSSAAQAVLLTGSGDVTIKCDVTATAGHGIQAGTGATAYSGKLTLDGAVLTVAKRGVMVYKEDTGFGIVVLDSTIQSNVAVPTTTYTTGNDAMALSLGTTDGKGYSVGITNSMLQGFSYCINSVSSGSNLTVDMHGGKTYGRAALNVWGSNNTFTLDGVEVHGLNNQTGSTEAFACIVDNKGAENNTYNINGCTFVAELSAAASASGSSASEQMIDLRGTKATVKITGATTYAAKVGGETVNPTDEGYDRFGLIFSAASVATPTENAIDLDQTATASLADVLEVLPEGVDETESEVFADGTNLGYRPEVHYYWATQSGYDGGYYSFNDPFDNGWLDNGEFIALQKDVTLNKDLSTAKSFNLLLGDYTLTAGDYKIALAEGVTVTSDKAGLEALFAAPDGYGIASSTEGLSHTYTVVACVAVNVGTGVKYVTLQAALSDAQNGDTVMLLGDVTITQTVTVENKSIVIDGDGHKIIATGGNAGNKVYYALYFVAEVEGVSIEIKNTSVEASGYQVATLFNCDYTTSVRIDNVTMKSDGACIYANGLAVVDVSNSALTHEGAYTAGKTDVYYSAVMVGYGGTVNLRSSTVYSTDYGVATFPSGGTINIYDVEVTAKNVSGTSTVSDPSAIYVWVGDEYTHEMAKNAAVVVHEGAKINGAFKFKHQKNNGVKTAIATIEGGVFSADIAALSAAATADCGLAVVPGYAAVANTDPATSATYPWTVGYDGVVYPTGNTEAGLETVGVPIPNSWIAEKGVTGTTAEAKIAALGQNGKNGMPKWESYVLGLNPNEAASRLILSGTKATAEGLVTITGLNVAIPATLDAATTVGFHLEEATPADAAADKWTARAEACTMVEGKPTFTVSVPEISGKVLRIVADITTEAK